MKVQLEYGQDGLAVEIPGRHVSVLAPRFVPGLPDEYAAFLDAVRRPLGAKPLREVVRGSERVAVVIPDGTRALPTERLLPWVLAELGDLPPAQIMIINGTGSHRANTPAELGRMVGREVFERYRVINHDAHDPATLAPAGRGEDGFPVSFNRAYVEADRRIVLGFIEPHLMAGFSGGAKGIFPAVADIGSIMRYHNAAMIAHPRSTWGVLEGNPTQARIRHDSALLPLDFCINVTLNRARAITGFFCGDVRTAHAAGCAASKRTAMIACAQPFPIIVTTNSGAPLDQNLYQSVKGMSAAAQVVAEGGCIITAARCEDGFPAHGNFRRLLIEHASPEALLATLLAPGFSIFDQWQAQVFAMIRIKARLALYSELPAAEARQAHLEPVADIAAAVQSELDRLGNDTPVAVLPEGPMVIPYLA